MKYDYYEKTEENRIERARDHIQRNCLRSRLKDSLRKSTECGVIGGLRDSLKDSFGVSQSGGLKKRLKSEAGFTLTETLAAIIIMSLVGLMVTAGMVTAIRVYREVTEYAEAQSLLSNTMTLLEDELIYAKANVDPTEDHKMVTFDHATKGMVVISAKESTTGGIAIDYKKDGSFTGHPQPLVGYQKREDIYTDWDVNFNVTEKKFTINLYVKKKENGSEQTIIKIEDIYIVPVNYGT